MCYICLKSLRVLLSSLILYSLLVILLKCSLAPRNRDAECPPRDVRFTFSNCIIIDPVIWNNLIQGHPELASEGLSCVKTYSTIGQRYAGPKDAVQIIEWFLTNIASVS
jgi:hypothetical protein